MVPCLGVWGLADGSSRPGPVHPRTAGFGAAYGTAKAGVGIASMGVLRPDLVIKSIIPVVMAGVLGIYGLIIAVIISTGSACGGAEGPAGGERKGGGEPRACDLHKTTGWNCAGECHHGHCH